MHPSFSIYVTSLPDALEMLLLCRLEIIDWFHHVDNVHGVTDDIQDIVKGFVGHRSLVNGTFVYRCCIYACHLLLVFLEESSLIAWVRDMMRPAPCGAE